jgi:triacylglycerol esterase/lipase EstA (alpha/beta hydrolase family)
VVLALVTAVVPLAVAASAATPQLVPGTLVQGVLADVANPGGTPAGMNMWACRPTTAHPYPVILLHGTLFNENLTWQALSPELVDAGYCVYGFDYGSGPDSAFGTYGVSDIAASARQLATFVDYVRIAAHAHEVDIVGHSQGGMMPRYYMKFLGGRTAVHMLIGLAPSNHGTTLDGGAPLLTALHSLGLDVFTTSGCVACTQQINGQGSDLLARLNATGDTVPGPLYVVIESRYDEVVTPYASAFLKGPHVHNILLQDQCPTDFSEHIGIVYDPVALQDVINALGPDNPAFVPKCSFVPPGIG